MPEEQGGETGGEKQEEKQGGETGKNTRAENCLKQD
jgi:hypothetical protein